jgi:hypothetical protein
MAERIRTVNKPALAADREISRIFILIFMIGISCIIHGINDEIDLVDRYKCKAVVCVHRDDKLIRLAIITH